MNGAVLTLARQIWIDQFISKHRNVKYVGQLGRTDIDPDHLLMMDKLITGKEYLIEYHMFETADEIPIIAQWRPVRGKGTGKFTTTTIIRPSDHSPL